MVLDQIDLATREATIGGLVDFGLPGEGFVTNMEKVGIIKLSAHETVERIENDGIGKGGFRDPLTIELII